MNLQFAWKREFLHDLQQMLSVTLKRYSPVSVNKIDNNLLLLLLLLLQCIIITTILLFSSLSSELHVNNLETIGANVFYEIPELLHL